MTATSALYWVLGAIGSVFWMWMIVDCIMHEPDKYLWLMILLFTNIPGAIVYFIIRRPVAFRVIMPKFILRLTRGREISQAELDTYNVPNSYNYSKLGDVYYELGDEKNAGVAYAKALELNPADTAALWGAAQVDLKNKAYEAAKQKLALLLKIVPDHRYGEAMLDYCRAFFELNDMAAAKKQLLKYLEKWSNPEAKVMLAKILVDEGDKEEAGKILDETLLDIKGSPKFYYNKKRKWIGIIKVLKNRIGNP